MGFVSTFVVVELDPSFNVNAGFRSGFPSMQIDAFILQGSPDPFDKYVSQKPSFAIH